MTSLIVCTPYIEGILLGNNDLKTFLYKSEVDVDTLIDQHSSFIQAFMNTCPSIKVCNLFHLFYDNISLEAKTNLVFVRDSFIKLENGVVLCNMKENTRKEETYYLKQIFETKKIPILCEISKGHVEGGDFIPSKDISFLGIGSRTNREGAMELMNSGHFTTKFFCMVYPDKDDTNMHRIHLDCIFNLISEKECVLWEELMVDKLSDVTRYVDVYAYNEILQTYSIVDKHLHFGEFLIQQGFTIIPISSASQETYGCNILCIEDKVFVQDEESHKKIKGSILIPFTEFHKMYGGIHCATNTL